MNGFRLPLADPPIKCYQNIAYRLSIILNHQECWPWFHSNFIQLLGANLSNSNNFVVDFFTPTDDFHTAFPWLDFCPLIKEVIIDKLSCSVHDILRHSLEHGLYIYTFVDEFYIPNRKAFQTSRNIHDILIYGINESNQAYIVVGYDQNMQYRETEVHFDLMEQAILSTEAPITQIYKKGMKYDLDLQLMGNLISDYINSYNTSKRLRLYSPPAPDTTLFGVSVYDGFRQHIENIPDSQSNYDFRIPHLILEHKKCMQLRMNYIIEQNIINIPDDLLNRYSEVVREATFLRNVYLKLGITNNMGLINSLDKSITKLKEMDIFCSEALLHCMK